MAVTFLGLAEGSAVNGGSITLTFPASAQVAGAYVIVSYAVPQVGFAMGVTSSSTSDAYASIASTTNTNLNFSVFRKFIAAGETQAICLGTARTSDGNTAVCHIYSGVSTSAPESVTPATATGAGATPDSPSITVGSANNIVISTVAQAATDTTVTAPTSFVNQVDINANDTLDTTTGMANIVLTSSGAFNPASWTNFTAGVAWAAASIAIAPSTVVEVFTWSQYGFDNAPDFRRIEIVGY